MDTPWRSEMNLERRMEERNYIIYRISNTFDDDTYIGCTSRLLKYRLKEHVYNSTRNNTKLSIKIRGVGAENLEIVDLYTRWMTQVEAQEVEGGLIDLLGPTLNVKSSGKFYDVDGNYDEKEHDRVYNKEYYFRNKDRLSERTECECGGKFTLHNKAKHYRTQRYLSNASVFSASPSSPLPAFNPDDHSE